MDVDLYHIALFAHIVFAIALVGGSVWAHVVMSLIRRTDSVAAIRSQVRFLSVVIKSGMPLAVLVLVPGIYMAFAGSHWGAGWPGVALVLFAGTGAAAGGVLDPAVARIRTELDETPDGPMPPAIRAKLAAPKLTFSSWAMAGADLAIVYLMTNKPGLTGSIVVGVVCLALGVAIGMRENRHATSAGAAPAAPAT